MSLQRVAIMLLATFLYLSTACVADDAAPDLRALEVRSDAVELQELIAAAVTSTSVDLGAESFLTQGGVSEPGRFIGVSQERPDVVHTSVAVRYWGAFSNFWGNADSLAITDIDSDGPLTLLLPEEYRAALKQVLGTDLVGVTPQWLPEAGLVERLLTDERVVGFMPVDHASPRLRSLAFEGVNILRGDGDVGASRLVERLYLSWTDAEMQGFGQALAANLHVAPPVVTRILATGDIIPARCVYAKQLARNDFAAAFRPTADVLRSADITIGSLDASISDAGEPEVCRETFSLLAPSKSIEGLKHAGFDVLTVATNHVRDCGRGGFCGDRPFNDTLAHLRAAGIQPVGGGANYVEAHQPAVITHAGIRFAFLGYDEIASQFFGAGPATPGTAALNSDALKQDIAAALRTADVVIVMPQWGVEYNVDPTTQQRSLAREAIEAGASLVVGNHPHVVQAVEWREADFITYALGNFVFDQDWSLETQQGLVLEATFVGTRLTGVRLLPVRIVEMFQPTWASPVEGRSILDRVRRASDKLGR